MSDFAKDINVPTNDCISRQAAIDALDKRFDSIPMEQTTEILQLRKDLRKLPSAQPERLTDYSFEESCTECPAYDTENHRCPRFNQVIRTALKDANLEPCEDCISRQAAIDTLDVGTELLRRVLDNADVVGVEREKFEWGLGLIESYISDMKELPSAQPERKKGKKIVKSNGRMGYWACDKCGETIHPDDNFCPNCGVDLRGE